MDNFMRKWKKIRLSFLFAGVVFLVIMLSSVLTLLGVHLFNYLGMIHDGQFRGIPLVIFALSSLFVGIVMALFVSYLPLKPMRKIMDTIHEIAGGNYDARVYLRGPEEIRNLADSINHMAEEIGSVELLRSDFVNNFSHEFKTPIVSIRGFAKLLKYDRDLTQQEKDEYLDIIVAESERLSELATNVLELTKLEKQTILTGQTKYNISEQIRRVIALLDGKWSKKHIEIEMTDEEIELYGNRELLQQVWINLLDNAIKFSPDYGMIRIDIARNIDGVTVQVRDQGMGMDEETAKHIFDKFYQGDTSHTTKGNGLGLTIAARIVALHQGEIKAARTGAEGTCFQVLIPEKV